MDWEPNAQRALDFYLEDVRHACRMKGVPAEPVVAAVSTAIEGKLAQRRTALVTPGLIEKVLASAGTPESHVPDHLPAAAEPGVDIKAAASPAVPPPLPKSAPPIQARGPMLGAHVTREHQARRPSSNRGCMIGALIMVGIGILFFVSVALVGYFQVQQAFGVDKAACIARVQQLGVALSENTDPETGEYPPLDADTPPFLFDKAILENVDVTLLRCANSWIDETNEAQILASPDIVYFGYALRSQEDLDAYLKAFADHDWDVEAFMAAPLMGPNGEIPRLRADLPDAASIPVLIERDSNHYLGGGAVFFLDGHVEFLDGESGFPMAWEIFEALGNVEAEKNRAACHENLVAVGESLIAHAKAHEGVFPELHLEPTEFMFDATAIGDEVAGQLRCPVISYWDETPSTESTFYYLGYVVRDQADMDAYMAVVSELALAGTTVIDLPAIAGSQGAIPRLTLDVSDPDKVPLLVERGVYTHNDGAHVLFLDGHVAWIPYDESFPLSTDFFSAIRMIEDQEDRIQCKSNLEKLSTFLAEHAKKDNGRYPGLAPDEEPLIFGGEALEAVDIKLLRCPSYAYEEETREDILYDVDYIYLGFAVRNQAEMDAYMAAYMDADGDVTALNALEAIAGPDGDIPRLRQDLPNPAQIPVLVEWNLHSPNGGHVVYLDGHVEYKAMEEGFPMNQEFFDSTELVWELDYPMVEGFWGVFWESFYNSL